MRNTVVSRENSSDWDVITRLINKYGIVDNELDDDALTLDEIKHVFDKNRNAELNYEDFTDWLSSDYISLISILGKKGVSFQSVFIPQYKLLLPWTVEGQNMEPFAQPYLVKFERDNHAISYLASDHADSSAECDMVCKKLSKDKCEIECDNLSIRYSDRLFASIDNAIISLKPDLIIVEMDNSADAGSQSFVKYIEDCSADKFYKCGEPAYAVNRAIKSGIKFIGAEPSDEDIWYELSRKKYTVDDLLGYYLVRQMSQFKREGVFENNIEGAISIYLDHYSKIFKRGNSLTYDEFKAWYIQKTGNNFNVNKIIDYEIIDKPESNFFEKIAWHVNTVRDFNIMSVLADNMRKYKKILIIYGGGHLVMQRNILENYFGSLGCEKYY